VVDHPESKTIVRQDFNVETVEVDDFVAGCGAVVSCYWEFVEAVESVWAWGVDIEDRDVVEEGSSGGGELITAIEVPLAL
jgi:hypothetical protein